MATSAAQRVFDIAELKNLICIKHHGLMSPTAKIINDAIETLRNGGDLGFTEKEGGSHFLSVDHQNRLCNHFLNPRFIVCQDCYYVVCNITALTCIFGPNKYAMIVE